MEGEAPKETTVAEELLRLKAYCEVLSADLAALTVLREDSGAMAAGSGAPLKAFDETFSSLRRAILAARLPEIEQRNPHLARYLTDAYLLEKAGPP